MGGGFKNVFWGRWGWVGVRLAWGGEGPPPPYSCVKRQTEADAQC